MGLLRGVIDGVSAKLAFFPPIPPSYEVSQCLYLVHRCKQRASVVCIAPQDAYSDLQVKGHDDRPDELYISPTHP